MAEPTPLSTALAQFSQGQFGAVPATAPTSMATALQSLGEKKRASVAEQTAMKKLVLDPGQAYRAAVATEEGNRLGSDPLVVDARTMTGPDFLDKYGPDLYAARTSIASQQSDVRATQGMERSMADRLQDSALGVGAGAFQTTGNALAGLTGVVSDRAGAAVSAGVQSGAEAIRSGQSASLQRNRTLDQTRAQLDKEDIAAQYQDDVAAGRSLPGLRRFGREVAEQADALWKNPELAGDIASEGVGSLAAIAVAARLGVNPVASIGLTEGGGAYAGVMNEVQAMSEAQLSASSPEYASLRAEGLSHEAARTRLGGTAGRKAGAIQAVVGAVTGRLVSKFEGNPLGGTGAESFSKALRTLGSTALKEATEEGAQGVSGNIASNYAIQSHVDGSRELLEGSGGELVSGIVGGVGTTVAMRTPDVLASGVGGAAGAAAAGANQVAKGAGQAVNARLEGVNAAREEDSPVSPARVEEASVSVDSGLREAAAALELPAAPAPTIDESVADVGTAPTETVPAAEDPVQTAMTRIRERIVPMLDLDAAEFNSAPQAVRNIASEGQTAPEDFVQPRVDILRAVTDALDKGDGTPEDQAASALWVYEQAQRYEALRNEDLSILPQGPADILSSALSGIDTVLESPSIKRAIRKAAGLEAKDLGPLPEVTTESVATPAVQEAVASMALLAQVNPDAVEPRFVAAVLNQNRMGTLSLAPRQVQALESAAEIAQAVEDALGDGSETGTKTRDIVRKEIRNDGFDGKGTGTRPSLRQHIQDVTATLAQGDLALASAQMARLKGLAEHYQNKVAAAQTSARMKTGRDNAVTYRTWTGEEWLDAGHKSAGSIYVNPFAPNSVATARAVETEARLVTRVYNALAKSYGAELKAEPLTELKPVPEFEGLGKAKRQPKANAPAAAQTTPKPTANTDTAPTRKDTSNEPTVRVSDVDTGRRADEPAARPDQAQGSQGAASVPGSDAAPEAGRDTGADPAGEPVSGAADRVDAEPRAADDDAALTEDDNEPEIEEPEADAGDGSAQTRSFDALPTRDGVNRVQRAYAFGTGRSRLAGVNAPMRFMVDWLKSFTAEDQAAFTYTMTPERRQAVVTLLEQQGGTILKKMNARLTDKANQNFKGDKGKVLTPLDAIAYGGKDFLSMEAGRVLNLVDTTTGKYDADLVQGAILAAMDWVLTSDPVPNLDDEKIAKMYGFENEALVTDGARRAARWGYSEVMSTTSLGQVILEFWNARANPEAPMSDTHGIVQALAAEILTAMDGILVEKKKFDLDATRSQYAFRLAHSDTAEQIKALAPARRFIGDAVLADRPQPYYFDDQLEQLQAEGTVTRVFKQKRGPGKVGKRTGDAIEAHRAISFFRNPGYVTLMKALGPEVYGKLLGFRDFDPKVTHVTDAISIEGKNASIRQGYARTLEHDAHLEDYAKASGKNPDEVATHFDWGVGSNERIMAEGFNGQSNKDMRHAFSATVDVLNMTTQDGKERFWLTVAQNTGTKTEKSRRKANGKSARKKVYQKYAGSIAVLTELLDGTETLSADQLAVFDREIGTKGDPMLLDALLHVAKYKLAQKAARPRGLGGRGDKTALTQFETFLPLEADGKTDGPIHSLVHFLTGPFTATQLADFMRGGLFLGEMGRTLNSASRMGDLYQRGAELAKAYLKNQMADVSGNPRVSDSQMAALRLTGQSGVKVAGNKVELALDPETGELTIGRNTLKNPLTVTIYGSGQNGIADKIAGGVVAAFYQNLSALAAHKASGHPDANLTDLPQFAGYGEIVRDLKLLSTTRVVKRKRDGKWFRFDTRKDSEFRVPFGNGQEGINFQLTAENIEILSTNLRFLLVGPLSDGINDIMGGASANLKVVQLATQIQSRVLMGLFDKAVREMLDARKAEGSLKPNEFLSEKDYKAVFARLAKYGAIVAPIRNAEHDLVLATKERGDAGLSFFRTLDDGFRGNAMLARPTTAGVSAAPMLNISRGDATMMVNYFAKAWKERNTLEADGSKALQVLPVYDGLNMPAGGLEEISERINAAVTETWLANPMIDVAESFADFLRQGEDGKVIDLDTLPNAKDIWEDVQRYDEELSPETLGLEDVLTYVNAHLSEIALETQARKNVMKRVGFSNDHMASAETPHQHEGEIYPGPKDDLEGRARWLNRMLDKEMVKLRTARDGKAPNTVDGVAKPDPALVRAVEAMSITDSRYPTIRQTNTKGLLALLSDPDVTFTPEGKAVLDKLAKLMPRTRFVLGSPEELTAYRNGRYPEQAGMAAIEHGQTDLANGVIYIANQATETVLHEMLHAALMGQLYRYHRFPETLSADEQAAVKNLEALMGQFLSMSFLREDPEVKAAADLAQATIRSFMGRDDPFARAAMVSEFVSWTLVNQSLAETLKTAKTRVKLSKLGDLVRKAVGAFKRLMGLQDDQMSLFANIAANSAVLLESARPLDVGFKNIPTMALNQLAGLPVDERLSRLAEAFKAKVEDELLKRDPLTRAEDRPKLEGRAATVRALVIQGGFDMDPEQANLFARMQAAFATTVEMDKRALVRVARIYDHAIKTLTVEDLMEDAEANLASDRARAERRLRTLEGQLGPKGGNTDLEGRPMVLSVFLALSQTDESLRRALRSLRLPKDRGVSTESVDAFLTSAAESAMNTLASTIAGEGLGNKALGPSLDRLAVVLGRIETDRHSLVEKKLGGLLGEGETRVRGLLKEGADRLVDWGQERESQRPLGEVDYLASGAKALAMLVDEDRAELAAKAVKMWSNQWVKGPQVLKDLLNEVIGTTDETAAVNLMVNEVRYGVQRMRQEYREDLPKIFADQFSREVTESEWQAMHTGIARTDLGAMTASLHMRDIRRMYADAKILKRETDKALEAVKALAKGQSQAVLARADALARFMVTGQIDPGNHGLQRNAYAIARLSVPSATDAEVEALRAALDRLVTIRAIGHLDPAEKALLESLAREEPAGFEFMVYYAASLRETEAMKIEDSGEIAKLNSYKGYAPMETREGLRLIVADGSDHVALLERGYTRLGEYKGSGFEVGKKSYYVSAVAGKATYNQSALQTVHTTTGGVDPATGTTLTGITAGRITGKEASRITAALSRGQSASRGKEVLLPLYGHRGQVVGYERHIDPEVREALRPNQQIDEMLGAWAGRLVEESAASQYNEVLVERLGTRWTEDKKDLNRDWTKEYVNLADPELEDPVHKDIWSMVPREARVHAASVFGDQSVFWVRRDMMHNALGYRMPSVGDLWVGAEPLDPKNMNFLVKATTVFLGKNAFEVMVRGERFAQTAVSVAKNTIVVKSVVVPVFNALSTMKQLMMNGVSPRTMAREYPTKLVEIEQHLKNLDRRVELNAEITAHRRDKPRLARLQAELTSIEESSKRMSIWPLIEAGEFMTISEGMTEADAALTEGRWAEYIGNLADRIPHKLGTVGRYAAITRDTALFQGMARAVQYGDFLGKAVLYDHLTKTEGKTKAEALRKLHDEFVAYNLLPGRTRSYLESMGLTWFWAFKLRSMKIALRHLRNNPLKSLLVIGGTEYLTPDIPGGSVGDPIMDNMLTHVGEGRLGGSIGPGMLFRAPEMHPVLGSIM